MIVLLISLSVLVGWLFDIALLTKVHPSFVSMKLSTAICFFLCSLPQAIKKTSLKPYCGFLIIIIMYQVISSYTGLGDFTVIDFFIDNSASTIKPGLPSIATILCFLIIALNYISNFNQKYERNSFKFGLVLAITSVIGYVSNTAWLYFYIEGISTGMAIHTTFCFLLLFLKGLKKKGRIS